jgi:hypothetical protein
VRRYLRKPGNAGHVRCVPVIGKPHLMAYYGRRGNGDARTRRRVMNDADRVDEDALVYQVADEALEAAGTPAGGVPTLMHGSYCFTCVLQGEAAGALLTQSAA